MSKLIGVSELSSLSSAKSSISTIPDTKAFFILSLLLSKFAIYFYMSSVLYSSFSATDSASLLQQLTAYFAVYARGAFMC
jgi:hypothetical protein